ncbi:YceI family protein [Wohlfahrtiimonas larvae]|uniref:YceI family protein n=1 Tax=Wohlfahrtiimonas larvae TaxID=1157986 RepID=A0ABP9MGN0_9GAMM|nr:YceI family protein [Wohlfahrtiimonas larvae]
MKSIIIPALLLTTSIAAADEITYIIDPTHTATIFSWDHLGYSTPSANFKAINGKIIFNDKNPTQSKVNVTIDTKSINTNVDSFDIKLQEAEWFNAKDFPIITFDSTKITPLDQDQYKVEGILTIKGISKVITLKAKLNQRAIHPMAGNEAIGFNATTYFNRSSFSMGDYVPAVSDQIKVNITVEAIAQE